MSQENTATFTTANVKAKSTARSTETKDHWLNRERRPGYRIVIRQYPECWGLVLCDQRGYVRRGIYHVERADVERRAREILGEEIAAALPVEPRKKRGGVARTRRKAAGGVVASPPQAEAAKTSGPDIEQQP